MNGKPKKSAGTGRKVGKYTILSKIAQGGMGSVYKAKHPTLKRYVLLKKLTLKGGPQFTERFRREARIMMDFKDDHIVQVYDHFKEGSSYYIAEEFVDGVSLEQLIRRERYLSNEAAALIFYEVCRGLQHAHEKGVIHRDMKPGNILISNQGEVKLVDFGIATSLQDSEEGLTRDGMTLGTPSYIPPEQIDNAKSVDRRADIYSLGVVLYEMLTGKTPFPGSFTAETIALIHKGRYTPPKRLNPKIAPALAKIVARSMRPNRRRRFQDLRQIVRRLERRIKRRDPATIRRALKRVIQGREIGDVYRPRRSWAFWLFTGLFLAALLAAGGYYLYLKGYHYEIIQPDRYGSLVVSTRIPASYKDPKDIYIASVLYRETEGELVRIEEPGLRFRVREIAERAAGQEDSYFLESERVYLATGRYRLKVNLEGQLHWRSFFLGSRTYQKQHLDTASGKRLEIRLEQTPPLPLEVRWEVRDIRSGDDLSDSALLSVFLTDRWVRWNPRIAASLTTGASYRFRVEHDGYYPQSFNLLIKAYQPLLQLDAELIPYPGTVSIESDAEGLQLLLDDSPSYLSGGRERVYRSLEPLEAGSRQLVLDPGEYILTVKRDDRLSRSLPVIVISGRTVRVDVRYDGAARKLEVTLK
ncbi:MAG: serine/threonine protein kinase [Spirochaetales bacterium]|nr:serine/threonine protein kinase [Spirochaetales bacterium]